jgi:hypothetical protein
VQFLVNKYPSGKGLKYNAYCLFFLYILRRVFFLKEGSFVTKKDEKIPCRDGCPC